MLSVVVEEERKQGHTNLAEQLENILPKSTRFSKTETSSAIHQNGADLPFSDDGVLKSHDPRKLTLLSSKHRFNHPFIVTVPRDRLRHHTVFPQPLHIR